MMDEPVTVIGAGPYGLATAAYLHARGLPVRVFGRPMEFWDSMPPGMFLKSIWSASSIADPAHRYTLERYTELLGAPHLDPVPLPYFADYGRWFQRQAVPEVHQTYVQSLARDGSAFRLELTDGQSVRAERVVVAAGIRSYARMPAWTRELPKELVTHSQDHTDFTPFADKTVAVLGRGQSAVQTAAFLREVGASVELIAHAPIAWLHRRLKKIPGPAKHLFFPPTDVGPAGLSWAIHFPQLLYRAPTDLRHRIDTHANRPSSAAWLHDRVVGHVRQTIGVDIVSARPTGGKLYLELSDGTNRTVDHLIAGTGYRPHLDRHAFIAPELRAEVQTVDGFPELAPWFESSVPNLYFAGAIASHNFGPLCRFVSGTGSTARQIARHLAGTSGHVLVTTSAPVTSAPVASAQAASVREPASVS